MIVGFFCDWTCREFPLHHNRSDTVFRPLGLYNKPQLPPRSCSTKNPLQEPAVYTLPIPSQIIPRRPALLLSHSKHTLGKHSAHLGCATMDQKLRNRMPSSNIGEAAETANIKPRAVNSQPDSLLKLADLPDWSKDNDYIHTGYRPISHSYLGSLRSFFHIHNETGNICSHFVAAIWMVVLPAVYYPYAKAQYPTANSDDWMVFGLFFLGGFLCYCCSVAYHVFSNHSHAVHDVCLRVDLFGITTVTAGCFPPGMWYTFPCADRSTKIFLISVCPLFFTKRS